jgi:hypothetical protein
VLGGSGAGVVTVAVTGGIGAAAAGGAGGGLGGALGNAIDGDSLMLTAPDGLSGACADAVAASDNSAAAATPLHRCFIP